MNPRGFSFPPPPPPPPRYQQHHPPPPAYPPAPPRGYHNYGHRGGRQQRGGRGRGFYGRGNRGGGGGRGNRGGARPPPPPMHVGGRYDYDYPGSAAPPPPMSYAPLNHASYASHPPQSPAPVPPAHFPLSRSPPDFRQPPNAPYYAPSPSPFTPPATASIPQYPRQSSYETGYDAREPLRQPTPHHVQSSSMYPAGVPPFQPTPRAPMIDPLMRWGYDGLPQTTPYSDSQAGHWSDPRYLNPRGAPEKPLGYSNGNKRDYFSAFETPSPVSSRPSAPPPIPSFGNPLPLKPPPPIDSSHKPKKKKRTHNQLGLTPKTEEHESSEEEDDADEETRLGLGAGPIAAPLKFTYRGRTSTLQSPSDIAAWIEERKKRYPTQARVDEKKKVEEETKRARQEASKEKELKKQEAMRQKDAARAHAKHETHERKGHQAAPGGPVDALSKSKEKAEKLRRKLAREERKVAKAQADAEKARHKTEESQPHPVSHSMQESSVYTPAEEFPSQPVTDERVDGTTDQEPQSHPNGVPESVRAELPAERQVAGELDQGNASGSATPSSSDASEASDWTSSSGSDNSSGSDASDSDSAPPEETTTRREGPERVPPPPREEKKRLCRHFVNRGRCLRGDKCKFSHELPDRKNHQPKPAEEKVERKGLLHMLLERQRDDEDQRVMQAISWLGDNGHLDEPASAAAAGHEHSVGAPNETSERG